MGHVRHGVAVTALLLGLNLGLQSAWADDNSPGTGWTGGGVRTDVTLSRAELQQLSNGQVGGQRFEYTATANCPGASPGRTGSDSFCGQAVAACAGNTADEGLGPSVIVFRRPVDPANRPLGAWDRIGVTCFPEYVPGRATPGMAMILQAFHDTDFAVPRAVVQPAGGRTLVNLETFFAVDFPTTGFGPDEVDHVDPARMLGFRVDIRPRLGGVTYRFGDGARTGPTTSLGGPYPGGDVRHTYRAPGTVTVRVDVTYAGQFRIGGGPWLDIPGTVTITGTPMPLEVALARARLVSH